VIHGVARSSAASGNFTRGNDVPGPTALRSDTVQRAGDFWSDTDVPRDTLVDVVPQGALETPPTGEWIGSVVAGRYAIVQRLGSGAMAVVFGGNLGMPHSMISEPRRGCLLDARSDVGSAGATLWTATVGHPPFDADDLAALMRPIATTPAPSLAELRPESGPAFADTIDRALRTGPAERWADARAFGAVLHVGGARVDALDWDE
jgi:hypothetical protein